MSNHLGELSTSNQFLQLLYLMNRKDNTLISTPGTEPTTFIALTRDPEPAFQPGTISQAHKFYIFPSTDWTAPAQLWVTSTKLDQECGRVFCNKFVRPFRPRLRNVSVSLAEECRRFPMTAEASFRGIPSSDVRQDSFMVILRRLSRCVTVDVGDEASLFCNDVITFVVVTHELNDEFLLWT